VKRYFAGRTIEDRWVTYPWDAKDIDEHVRLAAGAIASGEAAPREGAGK